MQKKKILLVTSHPDLVDFLQRIVEDQIKSNCDTSVELHASTCSSEASVTARELKPDLLITNLAIPRNPGGGSASELSGLYLAQAVERELGTIKIIVIGSPHEGKSLADECGYQFLDDSTQYANRLVELIFDALEIHRPIS